MPPGTALPDTATHRNRREISSETSRRRYILSQRITTGAWECSCPGWTTHRKCKHLPVEQARQHWMCRECQRSNFPAASLTIGSPDRGNCCWCARETYRPAPPGVTLSCQDVHLEDVM